MALKAGALTRDELLGVWRAAVDKAYRDPLLTVGEGQGLEVITQMLEQLARTSAAIDSSMQALYISGWSGATGEPATGEAKSLVTLTFERTGFIEKPLLLGAGQIFIEEQTTDWGDPGGVVVHTGRVYTLLEDLVFHPGDVGPFDVPAIATRPGAGYDNPLPGTIRLLQQPGTKFTNDLASIKYSPQATAGALPVTEVFMVSAPQADMFVPEHVGQYLLFVAGANAGRIGRIISFGAPMPPTAGSSITIEVLHSAESFAFSGTFQVGEIVKFNNGGPTVGTARIVGERIVGGNKKISYVMLTGVEGTTMVSATATATLNIILFPQIFTTEGGTAEWRILDWPMDWGLTVTNQLSPVGGKIAMLDALGRERKIYRSSGEPDDLYRKRIQTIADVVSPNAIRRALYRVLGLIPFCFREVGSTAFPGWFFDGDGSAPSVAFHGAANDAFDTDVVVMNGTVTSGVFRFSGTGGANTSNGEPAQLETAAGSLLQVGGYFGKLETGNTKLTLIRKTGIVPTSLVGMRVRGLLSGAVFTPVSYVATPTVDARRFRVLLDYEQFRAFFLVGLPPSSAGEFGFAFDTFPTGAFDAQPFNAFFDGSASGMAALYRSVFNAVDTIRAGGVGWQMYIERIGCP